MERKSPITVSFVLAVVVMVFGSAPALAATKSPKQFCKKAGGASTECVRLAKDAREAARDAKKSQGSKKRKPKSVSGKFCKANGANVGSKGYKKCVKKAKKAAKAAGDGGGTGGGGGGGGTVRQCGDGRDNDADGKIDFPADPDCTSKADNSEAEVYVPGDPYVPGDSYVPGG